MKEPSADEEIDRDDIAAARFKALCDEIVARRASTTNAEIAEKLQNIARTISAITDEDYAEDATELFAGGADIDWLIEASMRLSADGDRTRT